MIARCLFARGGPSEINEREHVLYALIRGPDEGWTTRRETAAGGWKKEGELGPGQQIDRCLDDPDSMPGAKLERKSALRTASLLRAECTRAQ